MASRSNHAAAASAASRNSKAIQPATDRRGGAIIAGALGGGADSLRTSRIAASDRSSAASVAADAYR
jgi:hypothetical protein